MFVALRAAGFNRLGEIELPIQWTDNYCLFFHLCSNSSKAQMGDMATERSANAKCYVWSVAPF